MSALRDRAVPLRGQSFHLRECGAESAPPLILLHALGRDARDWDVVARGLADRFRVLALDLRGHGESARGVPYSFELMRDDVLAFADALGLARFSLIGHSMGGTVAFLVAEGAQRVDALVVEDTPPPQGASLPEPPLEPPSPVPFDWPLAQAIVAQLNHPDPKWWEELGSIHARTLLVGGGATSPIPQERLAEVARRIPGARLVTIEGAGHYVHAARPDEFIALVRDFLAEASR